MKSIVLGVVVAATALVLFVGLTGGSADAALPIKDYVVARARGDTGADNLVSSIYLGYRSFDTLGETLALLLAVAGVTHFLGERK